MILVITKPGDKHGAHMISTLKQLGEDVISFIFSDFPTINELSFLHLGGISDSFIRLPNGIRINTKEIKSVLYRRRDDPVAPQNIKDKRIKDYIVQETQAFLDSLPQMIDGLWVSEPATIKRADSKLYQLTIAAKLGFQTPKTLITNSPEEAEQFLKIIGDNVAIKTLHSPGVLTENQERISLFTRQLAKNKVLPFIKRVKNCPVILQPYIDKLFELRITVVGDKVFPCAISSQNSQRTLEDWRRYDLPNTPHKRYALPSDLEQKCVALVKTLGLMFGCIDMIVTPDKKYMFLEINPNGQWLWIEQLTSLPITQTLAELLITGKK